MHMYERFFIVIGGCGLAVGDTEGSRSGVCE